MDNNFKEFLLTYLSSQNTTIDIESGFKLFLNHVKANKSKETLRYYESHLEQVFIFLKSRNINTFLKINTSIIEEYISYQRDIKGLTNQTINKRIGALKTCSVFLVKQELISKEIIYPKLKEKKKEISILTVDELKEIFKYSSRLSNQDKLIVLLLLQTGIRRTELCNILIKYINLNENKIYLFHTKTNQPRYIYFDNETKDMIISQIKWSKSKYLFSDGNDGPLNPIYVTNLFARMKKGLMINNISPHKFRHTFATTVLQLNGGNIEEVRLLLGHSSYDMTRKYLHLLEEELKSAALNYNPLNKIKKL